MTAGAGLDSESNKDQSKLFLLLSDATRCPQRLTFILSRGPSLCSCAVQVLEPAWRPQWEFYNSPSQEVLLEIYRMQEDTGLVRTLLALMYDTYTYTPSASYIL